MSEENHRIWGAT